MASRASVVFKENPQIPEGISTLSHFREWSRGGEFPERGRIDFLNGTLEIELSPEELYTHGVLKAALAAELHARIVKPRRGNVFVDRTRIVSTAANLSVEPDVVVVLWESLREGRIREVPAAGGEGRFIEFEGSPDLIVEVVSEGSFRKDRKRLPRLYAQAGVAEFWTVDARKDDLLFEVRVLGPAGYSLQPADADGWVRSPLLGAECRLRRELTELLPLGFRAGGPLRARLVDGFRCAASLTGC